MKAQTLQVSIDQVFNALGGYLGSAYVNQFSKFGRTFQVFVQADSQFRLRTEDVSQPVGAQRRGQMIPLGTLVTITPVTGPALISLYNLYPSATVIAMPARGYSTGQTMALMEEAAGRTFPPRVNLAWTGDVVPGEAGRRADVRRVRHGAAAGLSGAGRSVRELVPAGIGDPGGADFADRSGRDAEPARHRQQSLHPDRHRAADRAVGEERDSGGRVRARTARRRPANRWRPRWRRRAPASARS